MATITTVGATAGEVWSYLRDNGKSSVSAIEKAVDAPRAVVSMAIGWLAREGKLQLVEDERSTQVILLEP
jgi:hypothetical protein